MSTHPWIHFELTGTLVNVYRDTDGPPIARLRLQIQSAETLTNGHTRYQITDITARENPAAHGLQHSYKSLVGKRLTIHYATNYALHGLNLLLAAQYQKPDPHHQKRSPNTYQTETRHTHNEQSTNTKQGAQDH